MPEITVRVSAASSTSDTMPSVSETVVRCSVRGGSAGVFREDRTGSPVSASLSRNNVSICGSFSAETVSVTMVL